MTTKPQEILDLEKQFGFEISDPRSHKCSPHTVLARFGAQPNLQALFFKFSTFQTIHHSK